MYIYPSIDQVPEIYKNTMIVSEDSSEIIWNIGQINSIYEHIKNDDYYPTFIDKLTHLFFGVCQFHCFENGNKRMAIVLSVDFLLLNGYFMFINDFMKESENISIHVAAGHISKDLLKEILTAILNRTFETDENLKLKYLNAINTKDILYASV